MRDDGRLELDDAGDVVEPSGAPSTLVDLADPGTTEPPAPTALGTWASARAAPWVRAHRGAVATLGLGVLVVALAGASWSARPAPEAPPRVLALENAPLVGADLGGPRIDGSGHLSVAYVARAAPGLASVAVLGLRGPGLLDRGVEEGPGTVPGGGRAFVQLGAHVVCSDRAIATAVPSSYALLVRTTGTDGAVTRDSLLPFDGTTTALDIAIRDSCLAAELPSRVSIVSGSLAGTAGSSVADLSLVVRNEAGVPLTVTTPRTPNTAVETDLSPTVPLAPHSTGTVRTRLLVHDCAAPAQAAALTELPGPVVGPGYSMPTGQAGITVRVGLGAEWTLASYALPWTVRDLTDRLAATACAGHPAVSARLVKVHGTRAPDGSWVVTGTYDVRSTGIGITLGREQFTGPPDGEGSALAVTDSLVPGVRWVLTPTQLDGGAGRLPVTFSGTTCDDRDRGVPTSMAVQVMTADRAAYPFELPLDPAVLERAADDACAPTRVGLDPRSGAVTVPVTTG
jgi:hypothetical protein